MRQDEIAKNDLSSYISDCPSINEKQNFKSDPGTVTPVLPESFRQEYFLTRENQIRVRKLVEFLQSFPRGTELPGNLHQPSAGIDPFAPTSGSHDKVASVFIIKLCSHPIDCSQIERSRGIIDPNIDIRILCMSAPRP